MSTSPIFSASIKRSESEEVRITVETQRGSVVVDVRVWEDQKFGAVTSRGPTKKGTTLPLASLPQLVAALRGAAHEATRAGLLEIELPASIDGEPDFAWIWDGAPSPACARESAVSAELSGPRRFPAPASQGSEYPLPIATGGSQ